MPRELPLHRTYHSLGATFDELHDWLIPMRFGDPLEEVSAVRGAAGILDLSSTAMLSVSGPDSVRFLHRMVTNDIEKLIPGAGCRAALLEHKGRLLSDLRILRLQDSLLVLAPAVTGKTVIEFLERHIVVDRVEVRDITSESVLLSVQGPHFPDVFRQLTGHPAEGRVRHTHLELQADDQRVRIIHSDHTGESGFDVLAGGDFADRLLESLLRAGQDFGIRLIGYQAWNILRVESGIPWYGADMDASNLVQEARLEEAVSFTKGCYVGQETVARLNARGHVNRHLCGVCVEGEQVPEAGSKLVIEEAEVGWITSSVFSPSLRQAIAIGYIRRESFQSGHPVSVVSGGQSQAGKMVTLPFYQPALLAHQGE